MSARQRNSPGRSHDSGQPSPRTPTPSSGYTLSLWFQCLVVLCVTSGTFIVYYFPFVRQNFGRSIDPGQRWWQSTIIYQVYPRSFQDSNGDGVGDIKGITSRLDYFEYLGIETLWLSPVYKSPMVDFGYDVADFTAIDPIFGTMDDFNQLVEAVHSRGMKIVMDFIPNHTSDRHRWFVESRNNNTNRYSKYYIWADGIKHTNGTRTPPNNWVSVFGGSMWEWDEVRQQYYLHQFTKEQPDLNFHNEEVKREILGILRFWLDQGVDGFRVDAIRHMFEVDDLTKNEPRSFRPDTLEDQYEFYEHLHTVNQAQTHDILRSWREMFDTYGQEHGNDIFMVVEVLDEAANILPYYHSGANFPFNFNLQFLNNTCDGFCVKRLVDSWMANMPDGKWPNWVLGSHDVPRISDKMGRDYANALNMVLLLLPGTPTTYYGEELGMLGVDVSYEDTKDPFGVNMGPSRYKEFSRDPERSPMQWAPSRNAAFSKNSNTWLPVHPDYPNINVKNQMNDPSGNSPLQLYRKLSQLRRDLSFQQGGFDYALVNNNIFSFVRFYDDYPYYLVAVNIGKEASTDNYREHLGNFPPKGLLFPDRGWVVHNTGNVKSQKLQEREIIFFDDEITLNPGEGVVIRFWTKFIDGR